MLTGALGFLYQNLVLTGLTSIYLVEYPPPDCLHALQVAGVLKDHHLEDYEALRISLVLLNASDLHG